MSTLKRSLGLGSLSFYGIGLILGAGIHTILGEAAGVAGEALWMSFLLGSLARSACRGRSAGSRCHQRSGS